MYFYHKKKNPWPRKTLMSHKQPAGQTLDPPDLQLDLHHKMKFRPYSVSQDFPYILNLRVEKESSPYILLFRDQKNNFLPRCSLQIILYVLHRFNSGPWGGTTTVLLRRIIKILKRYKTKRQERLIHSLCTPASK